MNTPTKFYRYVAVEYAAKDIDGDYVRPLFANPKIELREYDLIEETLKGYWIGIRNMKYKWILKTSKKRWAYPTKDEALTNYLKRTESRIKILDRQLDFARAALSVANDIQKYGRNEH